MNNYSVIGKRLPRVDARDKVTGKALYTDDLSLPRMLCGAILRSPMPHARIVGIDTAKALKLPGVKAVVTAADTPQIKFGIISRSPKYMDEYPLAVDRVRFIGEEVAAVGSDGAAHPFVAGLDQGALEDAAGLVGAGARKRA